MNHVRVHFARAQNMLLGYLPVVAQHVASGECAALHPRHSGTTERKRDLQRQTERRLVPRPVLVVHLAN